MPVIEHDEVIKQYYEQVKHKYPELTFQEFEKICRSPFLFIRNQVKRDSLPIILIKYLGKIRPFEKTVSRMLKIYERMPEIYPEKIQFLTEYLTALREYDKKKGTEDQAEQEEEVD